MRRLLMILTMLAAACSSLPPASPAIAPGTPEFDIQATVLAAFNVVSGPAGRRDWNRFKELFAPNARIVINGAAMTPDDYQKSMNDELQKNALFEHPLSEKIERAGDTATLSCRWEARRAALDEKPFAQGTGEFRLVRSGDRWLIASMQLDRE